MAELSNRDTKYLNDKVHNTDAFLPVRATGPLNEPLPWVIELRVVGTAATIQVQVNETMLIGRADPQNDIRPAVDLGPHGGQSKGVSRKHAAILVKNNRINIKDLGSVNGTRLNGFLLAPEQEYRLRHSDEIDIGQVKLQVRFTVVPTIGARPKGSTQPLDVPVPTIGQGESILIIEDDEDVAKVFSMALRHAGFEVTVVDTAAAAIGSITLAFPRLIVLDLMLPDMNGLDLLRYVRKQPGNEAVDVIVCSGATGGFQMHQALVAGSQLFLGKPTSVEDLIKAVSHVLKLDTELVTPI
ncbi:MAG: response regulator [Anaerolineae bacterium]